MFIVWGTKIVRKARGRRADYCPICREVRPFKAVEVRSVGHIYYIPLGRGKVEHMSDTCEDCDVELFREPGEGGEPVRDRWADVEELIERTNPKLRQEIAGRLDVERRAAAGQATSEERQALIFEPFAIVAPLAERRANQTSFDRVSGTLCVATLLTVLAWVWIANGSPWASHIGTETALLVGFGLGGAGGLMTLISLLGDTMRYIRRTLLPKIARALRPLRPTEEEIVDVLTTLRQAKHPLGKAIQTDRVMQALEVHDAI